MQTATSVPNLLGRRLAGSVLYALLVTGPALPLAVWVAGMVLGPQALRERIIVTTGQFGAVYGRTGLYLVMVATVGLLTLFNLAANPRRRFAWGWGLGQPLMDDRLSAREKLSVVLASWWGRVLLVLDLGWIALVGLAPN